MIVSQKKGSSIPSSVSCSSSSWVVGFKTYRGHGQVALEASPNPVIDTLGLPPCRRDTLEPVALVPGEALRAYKITTPSILFDQRSRGIVVGRAQFSGRGEGSK